ncbi:hypothetical protein IGI04_035933 [Brassica rapa subsp. trilocularis]|uniref:Uncharacterized protein n=1 Tax=Brassica rapa subsp. trilocularis TaxID=1813537 RepID=A0ABQ7LG47_BRACM|nr:hypothetical protein IGI04_035933 [Brassica rapa subsp. trilocularis]
MSRRPPSIRRDRAQDAQAPPLPDFPNIPDIPMHDQGNFQRFVVDALQAIWARVSCWSGRTIGAQAPVNLSLYFLNLNFEFDCKHMQTLCASPSIDMERIILINSRQVTSIDMERITSIDVTINAKVDQPVNYTHLLGCLKEPKLTSNTNLTSLLVLGFGIHGIGFFKQLWKIYCLIRMNSNKRIRTGLGGGNLQGSLHKGFLDIGQKEVNRAWWQPPLSSDSWKPVQS